MLEQTVIQTDKDRQSSSPREEALIDLRLRLSSLYDDLQT